MYIILFNPPSVWKKTQGSEKWSNFLEAAWSVWVGSQIGTQVCPCPWHLALYVPGVNVSVFEDWEEITHDVPEYTVVQLCGVSNLWFQQLMLWEGKRRREDNTLWSGKVTEFVMTFGFELREDPNSGIKVWGKGWKEDRAHLGNAGHVCGELKEAQEDGWVTKEEGWKGRLGPCCGGLELPHRGLRRLDIQHVCDYFFVTLSNTASTRILSDGLWLILIYLIDTLVVWILVTFFRVSLISQELA